MFIFAIFCLLVALDMLVSLFSETYMNAYGNIRGDGDVILRFLPELCLLAFYAYFFFTLIRSGEVRRFTVLVHSGLFVALGLGLAIPFMGFILAHLTPVALVYTILLLHVGGYWAVVALAIVFSLINSWIMIVELRTNYRIRVDA